MSILVSGLINIETTIKIDQFPIEYSPVRYAFNAIQSSPSGVGYNVAKALTTLGNTVHFLSMTGNDMAQLLVMNALSDSNIATRYILNTLSSTPQSVILYDSSGRRAINVDLKNAQEVPYPAHLAETALNDAEIAVLCNINFSRPLLSIAKAKGKTIATDIHTISNLDDDYNRDFMAQATILFQSNEKLPVSPEEWVKQIFNRYGVEIVVIGLGKEGALLAVRQDNFMERLPAVATRPIISTIGAGDALFSAFIHGYYHTKNPYHALKNAIVFASYKIGEASASEGFLTHLELDALAKTIAP